MKKIGILCGLLALLLSGCKKEELRPLYRTYGMLTIQSIDDFKMYADNGDILYGSADKIGENVFSEDRFFVSYFLDDNFKDKPTKEIHTVSIMKYNESQYRKPSDFASEEELFNFIGSRNLNVIGEAKDINVVKNRYNGKSYIDLVTQILYISEAKGHKVNMLMDETLSNKNELHVLLKHKSIETGNHHNTLMMPLSYDISRDYNLDDYTQANPLIIYIKYNALYGNKEQQIVVRYPAEKK